MKHAVLVLGHGDGKVLQETVNILDDSDIDFYVHWDKKFKKPNIDSNFSKIFFLKSSYIHWGTDSQILVEKRLFQSVFNNQGEKYYDYVHLISSTDMPLMTKNFFKTFFKNDFYMEFVDDFGKEITNRINWYYPIRYLNVRNKFGKNFILKPIELINKFLHVNRIEPSFRIQKGANWVSFRAKYLKNILEYEHFSDFLHSFCADETYLQTIFSDLKLDKSLSKRVSFYARYIDWQRGMPYSFTINDVAELKALINTNYAFARKINDPKIVKKVFKNK